MLRPAPQTAPEDRAPAEAEASAALVALARLLGQRAAREHLAASRQTMRDPRDADQEPDHPKDQDAEAARPDR